MSQPEETAREGAANWEHVGRAAEDFARRVARDATRFAERIREHSTGFAHDVARDWRRSRRRYERHFSSACGSAAPGDVRRVFEDIRGVVADVLDGIDDLIAGVFQPETGDVSSDWQKVVSNRDVSCSACGQAVAVGQEAFVQRAEAGMQYRCLGCGAK